MKIDDVRKWYDEQEDFWEEWEAVREFFEHVEDPGDDIDDFIARFLKCYQGKFAGGGDFACELYTKGNYLETFFLKIPPELEAYLDWELVWWELEKRGEYWECLYRLFEGVTIFKEEE